MNSMLEIHDSRLTGITTVGLALVFHLKPAYIHRSMGRLGIDRTTGWHQDLDLVVSNAVVESLPSELPANFSDGSLSLGGVLWDNTIPLPLDVSGAVSFMAVTDCGEPLAVRGNGVTIVARGPFRYVEECPWATGD